MSEPRKWPAGPWRILEQAGVYAEGHGFVSLAPPMAYSGQPISPRWSEATRHALTLQAAAPDLAKVADGFVGIAVAYREGLADEEALELFLRLAEGDSRSALAKARGEGE